MSNRKTPPWYIRALAWLLLARGRALTIWLLERAQKTPHVHIGDYMDRWWVIQHPAEPGEPGYGTFRNGLRGLMPFYVRFHHIKRADFGRDLHDHPFWFWSIILKGGYWQEVFWKGVPGRVVSSAGFVEGEINGCVPVEYHRISEVSEGGCLTLVIHGRKIPKSWGFWVDGTRIHHKRYHELLAKKGDQHDEK